MGIKMLKPTYLNPVRKESHMQILQLTERVTAAQSLLVYSDWTISMLLMFLPGKTNIR